VLVLVLAASGAAHARTTRQAAPSSVAFWTPQHGLVGFVIYGPADFTGQLAVTTDGGKTWSIRWRGRAVSHVGTVPGTQEAWAEVSPKADCTSCASVMLHTHDGGRSWQPGRRAPSMPSFTSSRVGYALRSRETDAGTLMRTSDGGRTWHRVGRPCRKGWGGFGWSAEVTFVSSSHGWVVCKGQPGAGHQSKALYETTNGGATWKRLLNVFFEPGRIQRGGLSGSGYPGGISFVRAGRGLLWEGRESSYYTSDGGRHWRPISATSPEEREGYAGWFVSKGAAYLLVQDNGVRQDYELLRTRDGGRTWKLVRSWSRR
jgi:photosystem II stability/assembly factor-like uncharacterized protein